MRGLRRSAFALLLGTLAACATPVQWSGDCGLRVQCSRLHPATQTTLSEALVRAGGPRHADVVGWICGDAPVGFVRIVMVRYPEAAPAEVIPVVFEEGRLAAFGWHLLEADPGRYGVRPLPDPDHPWRIPEHWCEVRYRSGPERIANADPECGM